MSGIIKPPVGAQLNLSHPLARGLVGCWLMNEGSGKNVHDYSGQGNEGTIIGMNDPPIATSGWNAGPHGGALAFDGVNDYVNCGNAEILNISNAITIIAWATPNTTIGTHGIVGRHFDAPDAGGTVRIVSANIQIVINIGGSYSSFATTDNPITAGAHKQIVYIYSGSAEKIYVNNIVKASRNNNGVIYTPIHHNWIGETYSLGSQPFSGLISSVSIYNRALSAEEIAYLYFDPYCFFEAPPVWQGFDPYRAQRAANHYRQMRAA